MGWQRLGDVITTLFAKSFGFSIGLVWDTVALSLIKMLEDPLEITDYQQ